MIDAVTQSPYTALVAWTFAIGLLVQGCKALLRRWGVRHHWLVESSLPLIAPVLGAVTGALFGETVGLATLVDGDAVPRLLGAFYGAGAGFVSSGLYRAVRDGLPERWAPVLAVREGDDS